MAVVPSMAALPQRSAGTVPPVSSCSACVFLSRPSAASSHSYSPSQPRAVQLSL